MHKNFYKTIRPFLLLTLVCLMPVLTAAQPVKAEAGRVSKSVLESKLMGREMPFNVLLPKNYDQAESKETRYPVIYLLHGLFGHFNDWSDKTKLAEYATGYETIIIMPEGDNGWYSDSATVANDKYESYIVRELIPTIDKKYRTKAARENRAVAGLSMGGYGSLKFGLKYPELFVLAGSFSGALGVTEITDKNSAEWVSKSVMSVYGEAGNETRKNNDIFRLVREMPAEKIKNLPFIYLDCGTEDFLIQNNRDFLTLLQEKKIPHEYRELPGMHDWKFWDSQIREFLDLSRKYIGK